MLSVRLPCFVGYEEHGIAMTVQDRQYCSKKDSARMIVLLQCFARHQKILTAETLKGIPAPYTSDCLCLFSATPEIKKDVADATKDVNVEGTKDAFSAKTQALSSEASKESKVRSSSMSGCEGCECRGKKGCILC